MHRLECVRKLLLRAAKGGIWMAYRRFVSYIYEYSGSKKGENRGFVRVEVRNGICQMGFWMEAENLAEGKKIRVFGIVRENRRLLGIPLGELTSGQGEIRGQIRFAEQQAGKSPYRMDQMGGLLMNSEEGRTFATQWDDEPLHPEWMEEWKPESSREHMPSGSKQKENTQKAEKQSDQRKDTIPEILNEENGNPPEKTDCRHNNQPGQEKQDTGDAGVGKQTAQDNRDADVRKQTVQEKSKTAGRTQNVAGTCCQPFHDDLLTDCVKVTRQELCQLRKNGWQIDGSQFQNYGLERFGHLLLCRDAAQPGVYYIGVPGIFSTSEQFMAGMFGYYNFRPAKPPAEGQACPKFGYWCRRIPAPGSRQ